MAHKRVGEDAEYQVSLAKNLEGVCALLEQVDLLLVKFAEGLRPRRREIQKLRTEISLMRHACWLFADRLRGAAFTEV